MAVDFGGHDITIPAGGDLSAKRFHAVKMQSDGSIVATSSSGERCAGVLQNAPAASGVLGRVRIGGVSKIVAGASFDAGAELSVNPSGRYVGALAGQYIHAVALEESGAAGDIIRALVTNYQKNS